MKKKRKKKLKNNKTKNKKRRKKRKLKKKMRKKKKMKKKKKVVVTTWYICIGVCCTFITVPCSENEIEFGKQASISNISNLRRPQPHSATQALISNINKLRRPPPHSVTGSEAGSHTSETKLRKQNYLLVLRRFPFPDLCFFSFLPFFLSFFFFFTTSCGGGGSSLRGDGTHVGGSGSS